ncbi:ATP-grasp fold amidoligase family protein [uncultured Maribacter sp.]|uniref:ATP-grasp fold amidoligase family protein n=1 Tax=uncultured Maribacter sp. TaxID=431308 RepID=UPI0026375286|nr:ATP-grasp fold amidoligase family protein [uncultured Maribacter sp.]
MVKTLLYPFKKVYDFYRFSILTEETYIKNRFKRIFGFDLSLENPKTLNEKIQWLKLNDRTDLHTICSDKFEVRNYVKEKIGEEYLIPLLYTSNNYKDLLPENIPTEAPFIIKTNHDSGGYEIIMNKSEINWEKVRNRYKNLLKRNYYKESKEWQYKNIPPKIIIEKLLLEDNGKIPMDYKFHCFHGKVELISVDIDRETEHKRNIYSKDWDLLPFTWSIKENETIVWDNGRRISKPQNLDMIIPIIEKLSREFKYVRIDFYQIKDKYFFGEMTFHHGGGFECIHPVEWDYKLGEKLRLNID